MSRRSVILVRRTYYSVALITFWTAIVWTGLGIYRALVKPVDVGVDSATLAPLTPTLDEVTLASLSARTELTPTLLATVRTLAPVASESAAPSAAPKPTTTPSATPASASASSQ
jgi:hypothetical protein